MHQNGRATKQGDRLLKMQGKLDRGPVEFKSRIVEQEGEIMAIATRDVVSLPQTQSIMAAVEQMTTCGFRRLPVTDAGTKRLLGIVTSGDIINTEEVIVHPDGAVRTYRALKAPLRLQIPCPLSHSYLSF